MRKSHLLLSTAVAVASLAVGPIAPAFAAERLILAQNQSTETEETAEPVNPTECDPAETECGISDNADDTQSGAEGEGEGDGSTGAGDGDGAGGGDGGGDGNGGGGGEGGGDGGGNGGGGNGGGGGGGG